MLDDDGIRCDVQDAALVQLDDLSTSARLWFVARTLMSASSCSTTRSVGDVLDLEHIDQPVQLLGHLLHGEVIAPEGDGHAADARPLGVPHGQRLDVEVARAGQARDPVEDTRPVIDQHHDGMPMLLPVPGT